MKQVLSSERIRAIAIQAANDYPKSYVEGDFEPHAWVLVAMRRAVDEAAVLAGIVPTVDAGPETICLPFPDPIEIDWPELHSSALGCGVEDHDNVRAHVNAPDFKLTADQEREVAERVEVNYPTSIACPGCSAWDSGMSEVNFVQSCPGCADRMRKANGLDSAANGAIGEREAFEDAFKLVFEAYGAPRDRWETDDGYILFLRGKVTTAFSLLQKVRAALTAEKVAQAEPVGYADNRGSRSPGDVMMSAHALCPDSVAGQPARMRWIADYFLKNYASPQSSQPTEAGETGYAFKCDGKLWVVTDPDVAAKWKAQGFEVTPVAAPLPWCWMMSGRLR